MTDAPGYPSGVASAIAYARDVLAGSIAACRLVQLTCARFLCDLDVAEAGQGSWPSVRTWPSAR